MRILIADRHPVPRSGLVGLLRDIAPAADILEFDTAARAAEAAARQAPEILMCGSSTGAALGPDWMRALIAAARPGKVVVLGADLDRRTCEAAHQAGAWGHLPMTSPVEVMAAALRLIMAGGAYFPALHQTELAGERGARDLRATARLSERQREVLIRLERGGSNKEIAAQLGISVPTVKLHVQAIFRALGAKNRTEAAKLARELGLLQL